MIGVKGLHTFPGEQIMTLNWVVERTGSSYNMAQAYPRKTDKLAAFEHRTFVYHAPLK